MFGISTFCLHSRPLPDALEQLSRITRYVEVMDEGLHFLDSPGILENYSLKYSIHAPSRGTNLASLLEPIRRASVEVMRECFAIAAEVDADVVVHPGYFAWREEKDKAEAQFRKSRDELKALSAELSVPFSFENMGDWDYFLLKRPEEIPLIGDCGFTLDVGHANQNHCLPAFLEVPACHYHLHDNDATADSHDAAGTGTIRFPEVMAAVRRNGVTPVIEVATLEGTLESIWVLESL